MTPGIVTAANITALKLNDVVTQLQRMDGVQKGKVDTKTLLDCANRLDELTRNKAVFLSPRYKPLRKLLRDGFEGAGISVDKDTHLYDASRRLMKNIRGASHIKGEVRTQACTVCDKISELVASITGQQYFPN